MAAPRRTTGTRSLWGMLLLAAWTAAAALSAPGCDSEGAGVTEGGGGGEPAGAAGEANGAAAVGASSSGGDANSGGEGIVAPAGGEPNGGRAGSGIAGSSTAGTGTAGTMAGSGGSSNALCADADSDGFFATCDACGPDCDTIDTPSGTRRACGCGSGCPCGLSCGCYEVGPNISVCDLCVR